MKKTKELFLQWGEKKAEIEQNNNTKFIVKRREFWLFSVGVNIGDETSKEAPFVRPCLILNDYLIGDLILIIPLTSKCNLKLRKNYYKVDGKKYGLLKDSYLVLNQFKVISKKRLKRTIFKDGEIILFENDEFIKVLQKIENILWKKSV